MMKRQYSQQNREQMARSGVAMPDGSYPIRDRADLENAIQAAGRAKDFEATKQHIIRRARALNLESVLPEEWMNTKKMQKTWGGTFLPREWKA